VYLYDNYPGGVGLSEPLWKRQSELLRRAMEWVGECDCKSCCPACVGPVLAADETLIESPKMLTAKVLAFKPKAAQPVMVARPWTQWLAVPTR